MVKIGRAVRYIFFFVKTQKKDAASIPNAGAKLPKSLYNLALTIIFVQKLFQIKYLKLTAKTKS